MKKVTIRLAVLAALAPAVGCDNNPTGPTITVPPDQQPGAPADAPAAQAKPVKEGAKFALPTRVESAK